MAGTPLPPRAPQEASEAEGRKAEEAKKGMIPERHGTHRASPRGTRALWSPLPCTHTRSGNDCLIWRIGFAPRTPGRQERQGETKQLLIVGLTWRAPLSRYSGRG